MVDSMRIALAVLGIALVAVGCQATSGPSALAGSPGQPSDPVVAERTQENEAGDVTIVATWDGPSAGAEFDITLDTHSVDLADVDLADATLTNDRAERLTDASWDAPSGEHHRAGTLRFADDAAAFFADARWVKLAVPGVGGVAERVLRWEIGA